MLSYVAMTHDMHRAMKQGQPFVLMESCPSATNWMPVYKVKRPGMHRMEMLQAVGHGADATMYFQWRKGQGAGEKFHGAVVNHEGSEHTRVFQDVASWGADLRKLAPVVGTSVAPQVALIHDWEVRWALEISGGPSDRKKQYVETCHQHYKPFWQAAVPVDVIESLTDFSPYRLLIAPMLFMLKPGIAARLSTFVEQGGTLVLSYLSGIVNESNLCFLGGWPGDGLRQLSGIWSEEFDSIRDSDQQQFRMNGSLDGLNGTYRVKDYCMLIQAEEAEVLATYSDDFYAGRPALTFHQAGKGGVYYIAARTEDRFLTDFYRAVLSRLAIRSPFPAPLPDGVTVQMRTDGETKYFFLINATSAEKDVPASGLTDLFTGEKMQGSVRLGAWGSTVLMDNG